MIRKIIIVSLTALSLFSLNSYSIDPNYLKICNAYVDKINKDKCIQEFEKEEGQKKTEEIQLNNNKKINEEFYKVIKTIAPPFAKKCKEMAIMNAKYEHRSKNENSDFQYVRAAPNLTLYIYGDNLELQNGFEAWSVYTYICRVDVQNNEIKLQELSQGKIITGDNNKILIPSKNGNMQIDDPNGNFISSNDLQ